MEILRTAVPEPASSTRGVTREELDRFLDAANARRDELLEQKRLVLDRITRARAELAARTALVTDLGRRWVAHQREFEGASTQRHR